MKKAIIVILISVGVLGFLFIVSRNSNKQIQEQKYDVQTSENINKDQIQPAEKIEVVHFHGTSQCSSCIRVGEYALKTIKTEFPEDYAEGKIVYKDVNGDLPENRDIVMKYRARGASLYINAISNGKDNIQEDFTVWRLVSNENQFIHYFQNRLNTLLGK